MLGQPGFEVNISNMVRIVSDVRSNCKVAETYLRTVPLKRAWFNVLKRYIHACVENHIIRGLQLSSTTVNVTSWHN